MYAISQHLSPVSLYYTWVSHRNVMTKVFCDVTTHTLEDKFQHFRRPCCTCLWRRWGRAAGAAKTHLPTKMQDHHLKTCGCDFCHWSGSTSIRTGPWTSFHTDSTVCYCTSINKLITQSNRVHTECEHLILVQHHFQQFMTLDITTYELCNVHCALSSPFHTQQLQHFEMLVQGSISDLNQARNENEKMMPILHKVYCATYPHINSDKI
jgi:hypothetical protein